MKDGFIKVAAATPEIKVANCKYNAQQIISNLNSASKAGIHLIVFPELCITGYTCADLFFQQTLLDAAQNALHEIIQATENLNLVAVVGLPLVQNGKLYNCAACICKGTLLGIVPKSNLPDYGEFYEARHFQPAPEENETISLFGRNYPFGSKLLFACQEIKNFILGIEICEDLWAPLPPSVAHALAGATVIANLSASDEIVGKAQYRRSLISGQSARLMCGYLYADAGEGESTKIGRAHV